jgi:hypothetical protein
MRHRGWRKLVGDAIGRYIKVRELIPLDDGDCRQCTVDYHITISANLRDKARFAKRFAILFMRHLYVTNPSISYISYECLVRKVRTLMYLLERYSFVRLRVLIVGSQACTKCEQDALGIV